MSIYLKIIVILVGLFLIVISFKTMRQKHMSAAQSLLWVFSGVLIILLGIFPSVIDWVAGLLDVYWPPAIFVFGAFVVLGLICFNHAKEVSVLRAQISELTEQVSVMKYQLQQKQVINKGEREE